MSESDDIPVYHVAPDLRSLIDHGRTEAIKAHLQQNPDADRQADSNGLLPVHHAIKSGKDAVTELLVNHNDPSGYLLPGDTTLAQFSALHGKFEFMNRLCEWEESHYFRADLDENSLLHYASFNGDLYQWLSIYKIGLDPFIANQKGKTPVDLAVEENHVSLVDHLCSQKKFREQMSQFHYNYLTLAVKRNSTEMIQLLDKFADLTSAEWKELLEIAVGYEKEQSVNALLASNQIKADLKSQISNEFARSLGRLHPCYELLISA